MARVVLVRHGDDPDDDRVVTYFRFHGIEPEICKPFKGERLGEVDSSVIGSVLYGGPFNVFEEDRHPFLHAENRWIEQCIARNVPLLGICQGGQSIARVLGAAVGPKPGEPHEFGYYEIRATESGRAYLPERLVVAESHSTSSSCRPGPTSSPRAMPSRNRPSGTAHAPSPSSSTPSRRRPASAAGRRGTAPPTAGPAPRPARSRTR
jgi:GMP synthase (glutamine-hydrolysing)